MSFTHVSVVQFHGEVPVEAALAGIVARPEVLPDAGVPRLTHTERRGRRTLPLPKDPSQFVSLLELRTRLRVNDCKEVIVLIRSCLMTLYAFTLRRLVSKQGCVHVSVSSESVMASDSRAAICFSTVSV